MESNSSSIITVLDVLQSYENLNLATELAYHDKNGKADTGLIRVFADHSHKIDFSSADYEKHWSNLKHYYTRLIEKLRINKRKSNLPKHRDFDLDDIFYSKELFPNLCSENPR